MTDRITFQLDLDMCETQAELDRCHQKHILLVTDNPELLTKIYQKMYEIIDRGLKENTIY